MILVILTINSFSLLTETIGEFTHPSGNVSESRINGNNSVQDRLPNEKTYKEFEKRADSNLLNYTKDVLEIEKELLTIDTSESHQRIRIDLSKNNDYSDESAIPLNGIKIESTTGKMFQNRAITKTNDKSRFTDKINELLNHDRLLFKIKSHLTNISQDSFDNKSDKRERTKKANFNSSSPSEFTFPNGIKTVELNEGNLHLLRTNQTGSNKLEDNVTPAVSNKNQNMDGTSKNVFNESIQCPGPNSGLISRDRKSRYLGFPDKSNLVVTLNLLKGTAFMMGLNTLHEVDIAFPLPRSLFAFEYEIMHYPLTYMAPRPTGKPADSRISEAVTKISGPNGKPIFIRPVPNTFQSFYQRRSADDRHALFSQIDSALQVFGYDGKSCILHMICMSRTSSTPSLLHELYSHIFTRNIPRSYDIEEEADCGNYKCSGILEGLSKYLHNFLPSNIN